MDLLLSSLLTAFWISFTIVALATLLAGVWLCSTYIGHPLGMLVCKLTCHFRPGDTQREHNHAGYVGMVQCLTAGFLGLFLCWIGLMYEVIHLLTVVENGDVDVQWNIWSMVQVSLKGSVEGLIALGLLSGTVRVFGLTMQ